MRSLGYPDSYSFQIIRQICLQLLPGIKEPRTNRANIALHYCRNFLMRQTLNVTELCDLYGVSRKTGYKWIDRYLRLGPAGLEERS